MSIFQSHRLMVVAEAFSLCAEAAADGELAAG